MLAKCPLAKCPLAKCPDTLFYSFLYCLGKSESKNILGQRLFLIVFN